MQTVFPVTIVLSVYESFCLDIFMGCLQHGIRVSTNIIPRFNGLDRLWRLLSVDVFWTLHHRRWVRAKSLVWRSEVVKGTINGEVLDLRHHYSCKDYMEYKKGGGREDFSQLNLFQWTG